MIDQTRSPIDLMRLRANALFVHDDHLRIRSINQWNGGVAPRFYMGLTASRHICRFRTDVPEELADQLRVLCRAEPVTHDLNQAPRFRDAYMRLLASHADIEQIWAGPAYMFGIMVVPGTQAVAIKQDNTDILRGGFEEWIPDVPHRQPFMAVVEAGQAISVCASVRITAAAHEAGVETLPDHRRKGHAVNAVAGWALAVRELGAIPFYSTSWDNMASQKVAARLGMSLVGADFHIT